MDRFQFPRFPEDVSFLNGRRLPCVDLQASNGSKIDLSALSGLTVVFVQPGSSAAITPKEGWVDGIKKIPGAAGCTGQCKAFQSSSEDFVQLGVKVVGLSGQTPDELKAVKEKLGIAYDLVSDSNGAWLSGLGLRQIPYADPTGDGTKPYHPRMILLVKDGAIMSAIVPELTPEGATASADKALQAARELLHQ